MDAFVQKLELDQSAIMEASLCDNSKFVAFITKIFQIENYMPIMLYSDDLPCPEMKFTLIEALSRDG